MPGGQNHYELTGLSATPAPPFYEIWLTATNRAGIGDKSKVLRHSLSFKGFFFLFETIHSGIIILLTYKAGGNTAAICSFGRRLTQVSKTNVELPCRVIGNINKTSWTFNGQPIASSTQQQENNNKQLVTQNGTSYLIVTDLKRSDTGNYSCSVKSESINYQLTVAGLSVFLKKRRRLRVGCNRLISLSRQWVQLRQRST